LANKIIIPNDKKEEPEKPKEKSALTSVFQKAADFDFYLSRDVVRKQTPFALFIAVLLMLHIWNAHNTEKLIRNTDRVNKENKELRSEYISILSELMSESKQSSVAQKLDSLGIKELTSPPYTIRYRGY
jgi:cell division protein FtsL